MFKNPFSVDGRFKRTEYRLTFIIHVVIATVLSVLLQSVLINNNNSTVAIVALIFYMQCRGFYGHKVPDVAIAEVTKNGSN